MKYYIKEIKSVSNSVLKNYNFNLDNFNMEIVKCARQHAGDTDIFN